MTTTSSKFETAFQYTLSNEGGYTDDPNDHGGCTNYGLTLKDCLEASWLGIQNCEDLKGMTVAQARSVYYQLYWLFGEVGDTRVATKLFDMTVNMGPHAILLAQRAANNCGVPIPVDGKFGPITKNAINNTDPDKYLAELVDQSLSYYERIVERDPSQVVFLNGWSARAKRLPDKGWEESIHG